MKKNARQAVHNYCAIQYLLSNKICKPQELYKEFPDLNKQTVRRHVASFMSYEIPYYKMSKKFFAAQAELTEYKMSEESLAYKVCREVLAIV